MLVDGNEVASRIGDDAATVPVAQRRTRTPCVTSHSAMKVLVLVFWLMNWESGVVVTGAVAGPGGNSSDAPGLSVSVKLLVPGIRKSQKLKVLVIAIFGAICHVAL